MLPNPATGIFNLVIRGVKDMDFDRHNNRSHRENNLQESGQTNCAGIFNMAIDITSFRARYIHGEGTADIQSITKKLVIQ